MALGVVKARIGATEIVRGTGATATSAASLTLLATTDGIWTELVVVDNNGVTTRHNPAVVSSVVMGDV